jgi:outer membrane protein OmpA-like peptidoglycan-associated protein
MIFLSWILLLCSDVVAAEAPLPLKVRPKTLQTRTFVEELQDEQRWRIFLGADFGLIRYSPVNELTEGSRLGVMTGAKVLLSRYTQQWVYDGAFGWQFMTASGTNPDQSKSKSTARTTFLELSARYRTKAEWQLGPVVNVWLATDNGLNPDIRSNAGNNGIFGGFQANKEWETQEGWRLRLGGRGLIDVNAKDKTVLVAQALFQIGFPFGAETYTRKVWVEKTPSREQTLTAQDLRAIPSVNTPDPIFIDSPETVNPNELTSVIRPPAPIAKNPFQEAQPQLVVTFDMSRVTFASNSASLPSAQQAKLKKLGRFLAANPTKWDRLVISGHTDSTGIASKNWKLSKARAERVRALILAGGVSSKRVVAKGFGSKKPLDPRKTKAAYSKNRRVEFEFFGVTDAMVIRKGMK